MNPLKIFIDGSALGNGKAGVRAGYAVVFPQHPALTVAEPLAVGPSGERPTNNRAEFAAFLHALKISQHIDGLPKLVDVYTDSKLLQDSVTKWMPGWKARGWRKADGAAVLNRDIIEAIDKELQTLKSMGTKVEMHHVLAHTGKKDELSQWNAVADRMAKEAAECKSRIQMSR